jgi:hypothetical protein
VACFHIDLRRFEANESGVMEREATAAGGARDETGDDNVEYTVRCLWIAAPRCFCE